MILAVLPLIIFLFWYAFHHFSDDTSAIESFHSVESIAVEGRQEPEIMRKSERIRCRCGVALIEFDFYLHRSFRSTVDSRQLNVHFTEGPTKSIQNGADDSYSLPRREKLVNVSTVALTISLC